MPIVVSLQLAIFIHHGILTTIRSVHESSVVWNSLAKWWVAGSIPARVSYLPRTHHGTLPNVLHPKQPLLKKSYPLAFCSRHVTIKAKIRRQMPGALKRDWLIFDNYWGKWLDHDYKTATGGARSTRLYANQYPRQMSALDTHTNGIWTEQPVTGP